MPTILKYGLIFLLLFSEILALGQSHVFYQQVSKGLNLDSIQSVISYSPGEFIIIGQHKGLSSRLYALGFGELIEITNSDQIDLNDASLTISDEVPVLLCLDACFRINVENKSLERITCANIKQTQRQTFAENIIISSGIIDRVPVIKHPDLDQSFLYHQNKIYKYSESINTRFNYWAINELKAHSSLISLPLGEGQFVLSFYTPNSVYFYQNETYTDVFSLPQNEAIAGKERLYLHAEEKDGYVYFTTDDFSLIRLSLQDYKLEYLGQRPAELKNIFKDSQGRIWIGSKYGTIYQYDDLSKAIVPRFNIDREKVNTFRIYEDSNGWIWWGFHNGLAVCIPEKNKFFIYDNQGLQDIRNNISISAIAQIEDKLFLGTYSEGVFELDYREIRSQIENALNTGEEIDWKAVKVKRNSYFDLNNINEIEYFNTIDNVLGVRTKGAFYIMKDPIIKLTKETGYLSGISNFFSKQWNNRILLSLTGGFCTIDLSQNQINNLERSYSLLDVLDKEGQLIKADSTAEGMVYSISMDEPFLQIRLKNNLLIDRNASFKYRINNERWIQSGSSEFIYAPRTKGMHTIEIQKEVDHLSSAPLMLHFRVYKKWFKTIWFKTLLGLLGFFVAFYIYKLNTREKRLLQNIKSLETESLRSYMNPHFISNSLNSINFYILENKKSEASTYLVKFAKLIRSILQHTQNEFVLISQEIDTLSIYLDMEKMRFKDTFTFSIKKDNDISDDYQIPAMIIQPILENAILHGIRPSKRHGLVEVLFKQRPGGILVIIRDNGIGISNSMASKSSQNATRNSYGSQLIKRRIELLNELYRKDYEISISDRDADFGTIVQLKL